MATLPTTPNEAAEKTQTVTVLRDSPETCRNPPAASRISMCTKEPKRKSSRVAESDDISAKSRTDSPVTQQNHTEQQRFKCYPPNLGQPSAKCLSSETLSFPVWHRYVIGTTTHEVSLQHGRHGAPTPLSRRCSTQKPKICCKCRKIRRRRFHH